MMGGGTLVITQAEITINIIFHIPEYKLKYLYTT